MRVIATVLGLIVPNAVGLHGQAAPGAGTHPEVTLAGTQLRRIASRTVGQEYLVKVRLPEKYGEPGKRYPVLYLLDGDHAFGMASDIVEYLGYGGLVPELIIVSPAYGSKHGPASGGTNMRNLDFSVPEPAAPQGARGDRYLGFLKDELIPYVDREFRTDTADRALWGYSAGARFALYAMLQAPGLFQRYIVVDGFATYLPTMEQAYAATRRDLPARLFIASAVPQADLYRFSEQLKGRAYRGLSVEYADLAGMDHFVIAGEGLARGLKSVYNRKSLYEELLSTYLRRDLAAMIARYRAIEASDTDEYRPAEVELNALGIALYRMERRAEAITMLKLNVAAHPRSVAAHRTLADVYRLTGERIQAIEHYRKVLELDPGNAHATDMRRRLESQP